MIYGYARVSTDKQDASAADQASKIQKWIEVQSDNIGDQEYGGTFSDTNVSGSTNLTQRPAGTQMFRVLKPGDHVVITKIDRGFRSQKDFCITWEKLEQLKVTLHIVEHGVPTNTPWGRFLLQILVSFAEMERELISKRTKDGLNWRRENGYSSTSACVPLGWMPLDKGKKLIKPGSGRAAGTPIVPDMEYRFAAWCIIHEMDVLGYSINRLTSRHRCRHEGAYYQHVGQKLKPRGLVAAKLGWPLTKWQKKWDWELYRSMADTRCKIPQKYREQLIKLYGVCVGEHADPKGYYKQQPLPGPRKFQGHKS